MRRLVGALFGLGFAITLPVSVIGKLAKPHQTHSLRAYEERWSN